MNVDAILQIEQIPGASSDPGAEGKGIELLSFEHCVERTPVRSSQRRMDTLRASVFGVDSPVAEAYGQEIQRNVTVSRERLANDLAHGCFAVFKVFDKTSPVLHWWATKRDELLDSVKVIVRMPIKTGTDIKHGPAFTVTMKKAYIAEIALVGNFAVQPLLDGASGFPLNSAPRLAQGPIERVEFCYQTIEWSYGSQAASRSFSGVRPNED